MRVSTCLLLAATLFGGCTSIPVVKLDDHLKYTLCSVRRAVQAVSPPGAEPDVEAEVETGAVITTKATGEWATVVTVGAEFSRENSTSVKFKLSVPKAAQCPALPATGATVKMMNVDTRQIED